MSLLIFLGSGMQGYANATIDAFFVAFLLLLTGFTLVSLVFPGRKPEMRTFLLTFAVCLFAGGMAQCYSIAVFGNAQSTFDSFLFLRLISPEPPFTTMANMPRCNAPLSVLIWQQVYKLTWLIGFKFGPYTGVMFNALVMGLTGSLTVRTARESFGNDAWRLRRVGTLFAFCGLFILFGAVLIRDCFTIFFNALFLWGIVRCLARPTLRNFINAAALTGVSAYAMVYLRLATVLLFGLYGLLAFLLWYFLKRLNAVRIVSAIFVLCVLLVGSGFLVGYTDMALEVQSKGMPGYAEQAANTHSTGSLGIRLVVNQPLPIRLVLGSGVLMVNPIPLWTNFKIGLPDYHWIKGYNGIYQVVVLPFFFAGFLAVFRLSRRVRKEKIPLLFLLVYLLINTAAVVATSLEQRHIGQFLPAFVILAALPDTRDKKMRKEMRTISVGWFTAVVLVHLAWAIMKG